MSFHFDCVFYYVSDLDRAVRFYTDILGFMLVSRDHVARFNVDGVLFELVPGAVAQQDGNARLCLRVEKMDDALQQLRAKGVATSDPLVKPGGVLACLRDPDGNAVCLWEYRPK